MAWTVHFDDDSGIETGSQGEIRAALLDVASSPTVKEGCWPSTIKTVCVKRRLAGGRSGSEVLEIQVEDSASGLSLQVAKLSDSDSTAEEWNAAKAVDLSKRFSIYTSLIAVSRGILNPLPRPTLRRQAVIYQHVLDRDPYGGEVRSLEDVLADGLRGDEEAGAACRTLRKLMQALGQQLHHGRVVKPLALVGFNRSLGEDLCVTFDDFRDTDAPVQLMKGSLTETQIDESYCDGTQILLNSTAPPGAARTLNDRSLVALRLDGIKVGEHHLTGQVEQTTVRVEAVNAAAQRPLSDRLGDGMSVEICAEVRHTRAQMWSQRLQSFLGQGEGWEESEGQLACDGVRVAHPLRRLGSVLREESELRTVSAVHGDLNPRNVVLCGENPYLIDFAAARGEAATLADYAWLEVCALRDLAGEQLGFGELVQLQRLLAVLTELSASLDAPVVDRVLRRVLPAVREQSAVLARCLMMLWEVRRAVVAINSKTDSEQVARQAFEHLMLSACRALKFPDEDQSKYRVAVSTAVAAVATEALDGYGDSSFEEWPRPQAERLRSALLELDELTPGCVDVLTGVHFSLRGSGTEQPGQSDFLVTSAVFNGPLRDMLRLQRAERRDINPYIPLTGRLLPVGEPLVQQGYGALAVAPPEAVDLLMEQHQVVLVGDTGAGKSTIANELQTRIWRQADHPTGPGGQSPAVSWPMSISAFRLSEYLSKAGLDSAAADVLHQCCAEASSLTPQMLHQLLLLGAVHLVVDELHTVDAAERPVVIRWVQQIAGDYPCVRIVVCQRAWDYDPEALRWPAVALHKVRGHQAREYIEDMLRIRHPRSWRERMVPLEKQIFNDLDAVALRDLAGKPLFLSMLIEHYNVAEKIASNPGTLVHLYLRRLLKTRDPSENERKMQLLRLLAQSMEEYGSTLRYEDALQSLRMLQPKDTERTLAALVGTGVLEVDTGRDWLTFCNPLVHAFCAAGFLERKAATELEKVIDNITQFHWRDAAQLLVANPGANQDVVRSVLEAAMEANTVYGAWLLQAAAGDFPDLHESLITALTATMASADSGAPAWREASYALAKYGTRRAMDILADVARQADAAPAAGDALSGLVMMHQWFVPDATTTLTSVLRELLDLPPGELSQELTVLALRCIATAELQPLSGYVWTRLDVSAPWPVVHQAWQTLTQLRVEPSKDGSALYATACEARLVAIAEELLRSADTATINSLNRERMELLEELAAQGHLDTLLVHRFSVGLADHPRWDQYLHEAARKRHASVPDDQHALLVLQDEDTAEPQWHRMLQGDDDDLAVIAVHHILRRGLVITGQLLQAMAVGSSPRRLLALAAFVHGLDPQDVPCVAQIVEGHCAPVLTLDFLEPLSSLVAAVGRGGVELHPGIALSVDRAVREMGAEQALYWPWAAAWREAIPDHMDIGLLLGGEELSDADLLSLMGASDVLLDAPAFDPIPLTFEQRERLLAISAGDPTSVEAHRLVLLAASAGLHERRDFVWDVAMNIANCTRTITHSHPVHGLEVVSPAAHALTAWGYLSLLAVADGAAKSVRPAHKTLVKLAGWAEGQHPSLERARLIALGFLGDWEEILTALRPGDSVMHQAAVNLTAHWLPEPGTHGGGSPQGEIVEWVRDRLRAQDLPAETRAVLSHIRDTAEFTMRRYVR
ncbi:hypothetical protein [Streptomyces sp. NBC_00105]|uniref:hypothetical protein n=1 Tax=Streptomyces sp. NBC_00105 TaxID=2903622 RepID=UPI0032523693